MLQTEAEVEVLNIQINADGVDDAKTSIGNLSTALKALKELGNVAKPKAIEPPPGFTKLLKKVDGIRKVSRSLNSLRKSVTAYQELDSKGFSKIFTTMHSELPKLDGIKNATSMSKLLRQINRLPQVLEQFNSLKLDGFKNATSEIRKMVDAMKELNDIPNLKDFIASVKKLGKLKAEQGGVKVSPEIPDAPDLSSKLAENAGLVERLKNKFLELKNTITTTMPKSVAALAWFGDKTKSALGKIGSAVKKVGVKIKGMIVYRALGAMVSFVTKSLKEGVSNLYQYSKVSNGVFSQNMDKIASSTMYVKNAFGSLLGALIQKAAPYMEYIMDKIGDCINGIRKFYAELTGAQSWTRAKKIPVEFAEATENAVNSTEKLKRSILGFDKLNILDFGSQLEKAAKAKAPSKPKYSTMFEEVKVNMDDKGKLSKTRERVKGLKDSFSDLIGELGRTKDQLFSKENRENFLNSSLTLAEKLSGVFGGILKKLNDWKVPDMFMKGLSTTMDMLSTMITKAKILAYATVNRKEFLETYGNRKWALAHPEETLDFLWTPLSKSKQELLEDLKKFNIGSLQMHPLEIRANELNAYLATHSKQFAGNLKVMGLLHNLNELRKETAFPNVDAMSNAIKQLETAIWEAESEQKSSAGKTVAKPKQQRPVTKPVESKQGGFWKQAGQFIGDMLNPNNVAPGAVINKPVKVETKVSLDGGNFKEVQTRVDLKSGPA